MRYLFITTLLILPSIFYPVYASGEKTDFNTICGMFSDLKSLPNIEKLDHKAKNAFILEKIQKTLPESSDARAAWEAISHAVPEMRYELFQSAAESTGIYDWKCLPMKTLAPTTGEF